MRKKDLNNTFNINNPQDWEQKINKDTSAYNDTVDENETIQLKNMEFVQMYKSYETELIELAIDNGLSRAILDLMAYNMETNNTYIVSQQELADVFKKDLRTIRRAIKLLKDRDFITIFKEERQNVYFINPRILCKVSAGYKQKLIEEYVKLNQGKDYHASRENSINISILTDTPQRLVLKKDFAKRHRELERQSNNEIHKMNEVKTIIKNLSSEQLSVLRQLDNKKPLTDKEIQKLREETKQRKKAIKASNEYMKTLQEEQELQGKIDNLESHKDFDDSEDFELPKGFYSINEEDPYGLFNNVSDPLDFITNPQDLYE